MVQEYVPLDAYGLLRRLFGKGLQRVRRDLVDEDTAALYLVSRGLARPGPGGDRIEDTAAGRQIGLITWNPVPFPA